MWGNWWSAGATAVASILDVLKSLGFAHRWPASPSARTISWCPSGQGGDPKQVRGEGGAAAEAVPEGRAHRLRAARSRHRVVDRGHRRVAEPWSATCAASTPIYMMANSGAAARQADPPVGGHARPRSQSQGRDHRAPHQGATSWKACRVLEYFISTHGARKGAADTALRTADSGASYAPAGGRLPGLVIREGPGTQASIEIPCARGQDQRAPVGPPVQRRCGRPRDGRDLGVSAQ